MMQNLSKNRHRHRGGVGFNPNHPHHNPRGASLTAGIRDTGMDIGANAPGSQAQWQKLKKRTY